MHNRQLIILCILLGCGSGSAVLADSSEEPRSPWAQHFMPDTHTPQPSAPSTVATDTNKTRTVPQQQEKHAFNQAFELLKAAKYAQAIERFKHFIQAYPQREHLAESHYWVGEAHFLAKNYQPALDQFAHIMIYFADNEFARQALLKSADTYRAMQNTSQAKQFYQRVIKNHPGSTYAAKASQRLRQLQNSNGT